MREGAASRSRCPSAHRDATPAAGAGALDILYEDDDLLAVNKPPGVVVHPTYKQTVGDAAERRAVARARPRPTRSRASSPGSTRTPRASSSSRLPPACTRRCSATPRPDAIRKEYLAIVAGIAGAAARARSTLPLGRDPEDRRRVVVVARRGAERDALRGAGSTHGGLSLVRCELVTGRTHQIRVHLAARGWPIVGDAVYGGRTRAIARQALHAWRVTLPHPVTARSLKRSTHRMAPGLTADDHRDDASGSQPEPVCAPTHLSVSRTSRCRAA